MSLELGTTLGSYSVTAKIGEGGPAVVRLFDVCELWRGLAEANQETRR